MNKDKFSKDEHGDGKEEDDDKDWEKKSKEFWDEKVPYTPETRKQVLVDTNMSLQFAVLAVQYIMLYQLCNSYTVIHIKPCVVNY